MKRSTWRRRLLGQQLETRRLLAGDMDPSFVAIEDQTVLIGSPLHIPVDASDLQGGPLTVSVDVEDDDLLQAVIIGGNRSIRMDVEGFGEMVFELFEQRAPVASGRVIELAEAGFYNGIEFHRVDGDFVIQAGDPTGTGMSGSALPDFDDDFHPDLQHNRDGVLSFAKASDDTNNSQFFVTESPARFLDFNHSIFGQLIEGESVREAISQVEVDANENPISQVIINSVDVFDDLENSVVMLKALGDAVGTTMVTFTVTDLEGNSFSQTVEVNVQLDTANSQPFLEPIDLPIFPSNQQAFIQLSSIDIEGDAVEYLTATSATTVAVIVDDNGLLTVTPATDFVGTAVIAAAVRPAPGVLGNSSADVDIQQVVIQFSDASIDLLPNSDTGISDSDNVTAATSLEFSIDGVQDGATIELVVNDQVIGDAVAQAGIASITSDQLAAFGDGTYRITARETDGNITTNVATLDIVFDSTSPSSDLIGTNRFATIGNQFTLDLGSNEEGQGLTYSLLTGPTGAVVDAETGVVSWTPNSSQAGKHPFEVGLTDLAGNVTTQTFEVEAIDGFATTILLDTTDLDGNTITRVEEGDTFLIKMSAVDGRSPFNRMGVFSAYADILFDQLQAEVDTSLDPIAFPPIVYGADFSVDSRGTIDTGLIDELGAASSLVEAHNQQTVTIASVRMMALAAGTATFQSAVADGQVLMFGFDNELSADDIEFTSVDLVIHHANYHNASNPFDVDASGAVTSRDALVIINVISAAGGTIALDSSQVSLLNPEYSYNVSNDTVISALDALRVINFIAQNAASESEQQLSLLGTEEEEDFFSSLGRLDDLFRTF